MQNLSNLYYRYVARKNSTWMVGVIVGAFVLDTSVHGVVNCAFDSLNKGKLWKDVYAQRVQKGISQ